MNGCFSDILPQRFRIAAKFVTLLAYTSTVSSAAFCHKGSVMKDREVRDSPSLHINGFFSGILP